MGYVQGENRDQATMFPAFHDDYIEDNQVRFIDYEDFCICPAGFKLTRFAAYIRHDQAGVRGYSFSLQGVGED